MADELSFTDLVALVRDELNSFSPDGDIGYARAAKAVDRAIQSQMVALLDELEKEKKTVSITDLQLQDHQTGNDEFTGVPISVFNNKRKELK